MNENVPNINKKCVRTEGVAGAGKTTAAIKAIQEHAASSEGNEKGVLMFSLTNATIQNLLKRMKYAAPCYTVHSFCSRMLKTQAALNHTQPPKVLESEVAQRYLLDAITKCCPKDDPEEVMKSIQAIRTRGISRKEFPERYGQALDMYIGKMDSVGGTDFSGIIEKAYKELQKPEIYQRYDGLYVMCDETQDFNPHFEWRIVDVLRRRSEQFMLYSSPSQEIYSFCGANYKKLCSTLPDYTETVILDKSYRCCPEIVEIAKHLGGYDASLMKSCIAPSGQPSTWFESTTHSQAIRMIINTIRGSMANNSNLTLEDFAILARSKNALSAIAKQLGDYKVSTRMVGADPNIYKSLGVTRFIDYLSLAVTGDELALDNIFNFPNFGIREEDMIPVRDIRRLKWQDLERVVENPNEFTNMVAYRARFLLRFRTICSEIMKSGLSDEEKIHKICAASGIINNLNDQSFYSEAKKVKQICDNIKLHRSLESYFQHMKEMSVKDDSEIGGVNLCNYHSSKGREWKTVFLLEDEKSSFCPTEEANVQAMNTAYVAATRAMDQLVISTESDTGFPSYLDFLKSKRQLWF